MPKPLTPSSRGTFGQPRSITSGRFSSRPQVSEDSLEIALNPEKVLERRFQSTMQGVAPYAQRILQMLANLRR